MRLNSLPTRSHLILWNLYVDGRPLNAAHTDIPFHILPGSHRDEDDWCLFQHDILYMTPRLTIPGVEQRLDAFDEVLCLLKLKNHIHVRLKKRDTCSIEKTGYIDLIYKCERYSFIAICYFSMEEQLWRTAFGKRSYPGVIWWSDLMEWLHGVKPRWFWFCDTDFWGVYLHWLKA